ncbi:MAG: glycosyltransferase [Proteobacteria bacterium]|nr:MAG: glycosyltransferase [Pseudomonadota bacterium]
MKEFLRGNAFLDVGRYIVELIIVDDFSSDKLCETVKELADNLEKCFAEVVCVRHARNLGRAAARNTGLSLAKGDGVLFLDCDGILEKDYVVKLIHYAQHNPNVSIRGNRRVDSRLTIKSSYLRYFDSRFLGARVEKKVFPFNLQNLSPNFFATGEMYVPRNHLLAVNGFDEKFQTYGCEDEDLGWRLFRIGIPLHFAYDLHVTDIDDLATIRRAVDRMAKYAEFSLPVLLKSHPDAMSKSPVPLVEKHGGLVTQNRVLSSIFVGLLYVFQRPLLRLVEILDSFALPNIVVSAVNKVLLGSAYFIGYLKRKREV